ncbi:unnamed protein product [Durusdinium trenchii]|uniref:Uncharacterized protein n=1 Tax=Durusdinium trenchii TaxID=1381693 RepID=A0ABP0Q1R8_9DINO
MERLRSNMWSAETLCRGIFHVAEQPTQGMDAAAVEEAMKRELNDLDPDVSDEILRKAGFQWQAFPVQPEGEHIEQEETQPGDIPGLSIGLPQVQHQEVQPGGAEMEQPGTPTSCMRLLGNEGNEIEMSDGEEVTATLVDPYGDNASMDYLDQDSHCDDDSYFADLACAMSSIHMDLDEKPEPEHKATR